MQTYQPFEQAAQAGLPPLDPSMMDPAMQAQAQYSQPQFPSTALVPQQQQFAPRLPAETLYRMYLAWEEAKVGEINEQYTASRYYHAKQWTDAEVKALKRRRQPVTTKNRIKRKVDFLVGTEQRLRRDPKCYPRNPSAEPAAFVATAGLRFVEDINHWQAIASDCANDALVRGIGIQWAGVRVAKGVAEISKHRVPSDRFFYDPRSERWDFSDARYLGECQWLDVDQAKELLGGLGYADEMIDALSESAHGASGASLPQEWGKDRNWHPWVDQKGRRIRLISIWYRYQGQWMWDYLVGPVSLCPEGEGECDTLSPYKNGEGETVHPYEPWSPYVDESGTRYGVVRDMIPVQDEINKRSSKMLHLLSVRQTMGTVGAIDDVDQMKMELAKPDGHVLVNPGPGGIDQSFQIVDQTKHMQGQLELLQEAKAEIENLGPNPGLIGRGVEQQSGRAILAQQNSGMTELSPVFERMREWKLKCYRKDWNLMQQFWTGERWIRIAADPNAPQFLAVNKVHHDPDTGQVMMENSIIEMDVDVVLDEGPDTVTMREELIQQLAQLGPEAVPPEVFVELSNINEKDRVLKMISDKKQPPPEIKAMADRMHLIESMLKSAQLDKTIADTNSVNAETVKKMAEVGIPPQLIQQIFPMHYREPTYVDQLHEANALQGGQGQPPPGAGGPPQGPPGPPNQPQQGGPAPQSMMTPAQGMFGGMDDPRLGGPGGLPLPPNGMPLPGQVPGGPPPY